MNSSNIFNVNFQTLPDLLTPYFLRKRRFIDWLITLISPVKQVNIFFNKSRKLAIYKVTHNGQVFSLQATLNDSYDNDLRRIRIVDAIIDEPVYIYPETDNKPVYIYEESENKPVYVYDDAVFLETAIDFIVTIPLEYRPVNPQDLIVLETQIKSLINYYKLASKRYIIKWI